METIKLREEYIKLGQALKAAGLVESGVEAKHAIKAGLVKIDQATEYQRGRKLTGGEVITYDGKTVIIEK